MDRIALWAGSLHTETSTVVHIGSSASIFQPSHRAHSRSLLTMNPHISVPRQHSVASSFRSNPGTGSNARGGSNIKLPRFFKGYEKLFLLLSGAVYLLSPGDGLMLGLGRLFKFPQMDFEMAIWEMTSLLIAPKKVFKSMYYHVSSNPNPHGYRWLTWDVSETPNRNVRISISTETRDSI